MSDSGTVIFTDRLGRQLVVLPREDGKDPIIQIVDCPGTWLEKSLNIIFEEHNAEKFIDEMAKQLLGDEWELVRRSQKQTWPELMSVVEARALSTEKD